MILLLGRGGLFGQHFTKLYPEIIALGKAECDITQPSMIMEALRTYKPDVVINACGIVPKSPVIHDAFKVLQVNSLAPKILAENCSLMGCRLIHLSTNDVFSGRIGHYREDDNPTPTDLYGISKAVGEVTNFPHLTVRCSFVGFPDTKGHGLLAWFSTQKYGIGYDQFFWNGLTAVELARVLITKIVPDVSRTGLLHVQGETVSKYELLNTANKVFDWKVELVKESDVAVTPHYADKTLRTERGIIVTKTLQQQMEEMKELWNDNRPD